MCGTCGAHGSESGPPTDEGARIAVVGKGGVGKSTVTALLARVMARTGARVLAIDADEQRNLGATLGVGMAMLSAVVPVASQADYIEEKTGARPGEGAGGMLRLNPDTSDLVSRLSIPAPDGVRLVVMGGVQRAGGGCLCPEHALLSASISGMHLRRGEVVVMDTHAGVEHFGRALARGFDTALVVVEPTFNATQVGMETARLAHELGIGDIHLVVNRSRGPHDVERVLEMVDRLGGFDFSCTWVLPFDESVPASEPSIGGLLDGSPLGDAVGDLSRQLSALAATRRHHAGGLAVTA
jgi:CO dehydrogenase maturation factor